MQELFKKNSDPGTAHSTACIIGYPSQWTSTESPVEQSSLSNNLSLKMGSSNPHSQSSKLGFQFQEQDSSSTQSTCQSYPEVASAGDSYHYGDNKMSVQSECNETHWKPEDGSIGSALSMGTQDYAFASQADCRQPYACFPLVCPDPYYRGLIAPYGSQAMVQHSQTMSMTSTRVPLPLDYAHDEPIYVNAKQYNAILRRRQYRAKLEAQNKLTKPRKPYLHESRHVHALKRARGPGGRFLNMKNTNESKPNASINGQYNSDYDDVRCHQENHKGGSGASTNACSDITSASNGGSFFHQQELRFPVCHSHVVGPTEDGGGTECGGAHRFVSVFR